MIEDANGALLHTIALWFKSSESKYTQELQRWTAGERKYVNAGGKDTTQTISAPTRVPGSFTLAWDGKTDTGAVAAQGDYFVCVETAREHGPYQLVREAITIGATAFDKTLTPNGEITTASVALIV